MVTLRGRPSGTAIVTGRRLAPRERPAVAWPAAGLRQPPMAVGNPGISQLMGVSTLPAYAHQPPRSERARPPVVVGHRPVKLQTDTGWSTVAIPVVREGREPSRANRDLGDACAAPRGEVGELRRLRERRK